MMEFSVTITPEFLVGAGIGLFTIGIGIIFIVVGICMWRDLV